MLIKAVLKYLENVITGKNTRPLSWVVRALLAPWALVYRVGLPAYLYLYKRGLLTRQKLGVPVISVGNLVFGGTGKTPLVETVCHILLEAGYKPVVLSRGHGGKVKHPLVVSNGEAILATSKRCGDEPILLARRLAGVPIVIGRDRRQSGRLAMQLFQPDVIVLDDGMQYWQLERDIEVAVLDATKPFGSGFLMPAGDLREPKTSLSRANAVMLNGFDSLPTSQQGEVRNAITELAPKAEVFVCKRSPVCFVNAATLEVVDIDWVRERRIVAFCGIGNPISFEAMLTDLGADVAAFVAYGDHRRYESEDIAFLLSELKRQRAEVLVTTEKDCARLGDNPGMENLYALRIALDIEDYPHFAKYITNRVNG